LTTLIAIYYEKQLLGRCDERCYDATSADCHCVCNGKNHGIGLQQAAKNTMQDAAAWLEAQEAKDVTHRELYAKLARDLRKTAEQTLLPFTPSSDLTDD
jgi:hypothetical protein